MTECDGGGPHCCCQCDTCCDCGQRVVRVPRRLSCESRHPDFRPDFGRVGVEVDGVERNDITWYDADKSLYRILGDLKDVEREAEDGIGPFWRYPETRQMRRARERWEGKHS